MTRERNVPPARPQSRQTGAALGIDELRDIMRLMQHSDIEEITIERAADEVRLQLRKPGLGEPAPPLASVAALAQGEASLDGHDATQALAPTESEDHLLPVTAQLVGRFHRGARPGGKPLVEEGGKVRQGQVLGTIETLNVLTEVEAPQAGRVAEVVAVEGQAVEYGQVLLRLEPVPA
jgi:biotin carboxyl carrier protein